jgi:serine protein kinase
MDHNSEFEDLIKRDRDLHQSRAWRGNLLGYLEKVKEDPGITKLAHARMYDILMRAGVRDIHEQHDPHTQRLYKDEAIKLYDFFADEFFGIEKTVSQIVRYFHAASLKGEESRQVLYLMGPVGSGKSSLVEKLHRGLESSEAIYAIEGCPMFEEPLHLIPRHLRKEFEKMLGMHLEGDLCPVCRYKLQHEYNGKYEEFPV